MLDMTAYYDCNLEQMDVKSAYLHGELHETIYMRQPKGFVISKNLDFVCWSIYGLKQSPRHWNKKNYICDA